MEDKRRAENKPLTTRSPLSVAARLALWSLHHAPLSCGLGLVTGAVTRGVGLQGGVHSQAFPTGLRGWPGRVGSLRGSRCHNHPKMLTNSMPATMEEAQDRWAVSAHTSHTPATAAHGHRFPGDKGRCTAHPASR